MVWEGNPVEAYLFGCGRVDGERKGCRAFESGCLLVPYG